MKVPGDVGVVSSCSCQPQGSPGQLIPIATPRTEGVRVGVNSTKWWSKKEGWSEGKLGSAWVMWGVKGTPGKSHGTLGQHDMYIYIIFVRSGSRPDIKLYPTPAFDLCHETDVIKCDVL